MDWLKDKYKEIMFSAFVSFLMLMLAAWLTGMTNARESFKKEIEDLKVTKAPYSYVDEQNKSQDARMETIRKENREDHEKLSEKLDIIILNQKSK